MNRVLATDLQHVAGVPLPAITDEVTHERLRAARRCTAVLLRATGQPAQPGADPIIWEHGRRNFALREHGMLPIARPPTDDNDPAGRCILNAEIIFAFEPHNDQICLPQLMNAKLGPSRTDRRRECARLGA